MGNTTHFPEFHVSASMRAAASAVAASFHAYQQSCFDMPAAHGAAQLQKLLQAQRERRQAYHLALKFLSTAALKENPAYEIGNLQQDRGKELADLLQHYLNKRLNQLISEECTANPLIKNTLLDHPVMQGPW